MTGKKRLEAEGKADQGKADVKLIIGASISVAALAWPGNGVSAALLGGIVDAFFVVEHAARRLHHGGGSRKSTRLSPSRVR